MGKIINFLKKYSFGAYKTGLYSGETINIGSLLSVFLSALFLVGLLVGVSFYFNEIFILKEPHLFKRETKALNEDSLF